MSILTPVGPFPERPEAIYGRKHQQTTDFPALANRVFKPLGEKVELGNNLMEFFDGGSPEVANKIATDIDSIVSSNGRLPGGEKGKSLWVGIANVVTSFWGNSEVEATEAKNRAQAASLKFLEEGIEANKFKAPFIKVGNAILSASNLVVIGALAVAPFPFTRVLAIGLAAVEGIKIARRFRLNKQLKWTVEAAKTLKEAAGEKLAADVAAVEAAANANADNVEEVVDAPDEEPHAAHPLPADLISDVEERIRRRRQEEAGNQTIDEAYHNAILEYQRRIDESQRELERLRNEAAARGISVAAHLAAADAALATRRGTNSAAANVAA